MKKQMFQAASEGDMATVVCLTLPGQGAYLEDVDENARNVLHYASQSNNTELVEYLVGRGVDVNSRTKTGQTPIHLAGCEGNMDMVKCLISHGANLVDVDENARNVLHYASLSINTELVEYLVSQGIDVNSRTKGGITPILIAGHTGNMDMMKCLISQKAKLDVVDDIGGNVLHYASRSNNTELVEYLVSIKGVDVNSKSVNSPISIAVLNGNKDMVKCLIILGATINFSEKDSSWFIFDFTTDDMLSFLLKEMKTISSICALKASVEYGFTRGTRLLLNGWIDSVALHSEISKESIIHDTCSKGFLDIVRLLMLKGTHFTEQDEKGRKPFDCLPFTNFIDHNEIMSRSTLQVLSIPIENLSNIPGIGNVKEISNSCTKRIYDAIQMILSPPEHQISDSDKMMPNMPNVDLKVCGSVGEECRVGLPNEMDVLLILRDGAEAAELNFQSMQSDYVTYKKHGSLDFHMDYMKKYFNFLIDTKGEIDEVCLDKNKCKSVINLTELNRKACTTVPFQWKNQIQVSVDLVLCVSVYDWPLQFVQKTWLMDNNELKKKGYLLVPKPPSRQSNIAEAFTSDELDNLWKASFSHLEVEHINILDDRIKNVYRTAKCLRNPDVCRIMVSEGDGLPKNVEDYVFSYLLKSMFLKNVEDFQATEQSLGTMVCKVYDDIDAALHAGFIPLFFAPQVNVLDGKKMDVDKSAKVARIMKTFVRKMCGQETDKSDPLAVLAETEVPEWSYVAIDISKDPPTSRIWTIPNIPT